MTWTNHCGFEIPDGVELYGGAGWSIQNSVAYGGKNYSGKYALRLNGSGAHWATLGKNYEYNHTLFSLGNFPAIPYISFRFLCAALPSADQRFAAILYASGAKMHLKLATDGKIKAYDSAGTLKGTSTKQVPTNTWVTIQMYCTSSATVGRIIVRMAILGQDVTTEIDDSTGNTTTGVHTLFEMGNTAFGESVDYYYDDVNMDTAGWTGPTYSIAALFPNGAGLYSGWTGTYQNVDDYLYAAANDGDTTTMNTATASARFDVAMQSPVQAGIKNYSGGNVWGVHLIRMSSTCDTQFYIQSTGTGQMGSQSLSPKTTYAIYGMAWGSGGGTAIDDLVVGAIHTDSRARTLYDTAVWATITFDNPTLGTVTYTPSGGPSVSSPKGTYSKQLTKQVVVSGPIVSGYSCRYHGPVEATGYQGVLGDWMAGIDPSVQQGQYMYVGSGEFKLAGAVTGIKIKSVAGSGFVRVVGTASPGIRIKAAHVTGGAWAVGAGAIQKNKIGVVSGSYWLAGTAPSMLSGTRFYTGTGFIRTDGVAYIVKTLSCRGSGGAWPAGSAGVVKNKLAPVSGFFRAVGTLVKNRTFVPQETGFFRFVGSIEAINTWTITIGGFVRVAGAGQCAHVRATVGTGFVRAEGAAQCWPCRMFYYTGTGFARAVPASTYYHCVEFIRSGSGEFIVAGAALVSKNFYIGSGYFRLVGHAQSRLALGYQAKQNYPKSRHVHSQTWMKSENAGRTAAMNRRVQ